MTSHHPRSRPGSRYAPPQVAADGSVEDPRTALTSHLQSLRAFAISLTRDATSADDLVQDTLERAWSKFSLWRRGSDMRAWLFGIMHNLHIDQRRKPRLETQELDEEAGELASPASPPDALALRDAAYTPFAVLRERHGRRCGTAALGVWNDLRLSVVDKRDTRVGRSQVDTDNLAH